VAAAIATAIASIFGTRYRASTDTAIASFKGETDTAIADLNAARSRDLEKLRAQLQRQMTLEIERLKTIQSLQIEYDQDLRKRRIDSYIKLWASTMPLARYPEPGPLPYNCVGPLATSLRDWYFKGGGLFMSEPTRDVYFNLQDALRILAQKREGRWPLGTIDGESPEDAARLKHHLRPNEDWEIPEEVVRLASDTEINQSGENVPDGAFNNLRLLGSKVRTELAFDVRTREVSVLNIREQKSESDRPVNDAHMSQS
jgi:hypothetical protein